MAVVIQLWRCGMTGLRPGKFACLVILLLLGHTAFAQSSPGLRKPHRGADVSYESSSGQGEYSGHDEASVLFYSRIPGSGNSSAWRLVLPKDPPTMPKQDGTGGTFNFQIMQFGFWVSMALCDDQSYPNPGGSPVSPNIPCQPDSDGNIFANPAPTAPDYVGKHPGGAFMELFFNPPGCFNLR
jgi:hypothetical protein